MLCHKLASLRSVVKVVINFHSTVFNKEHPYLNSKLYTNLVLIYIGYAYIISSKNINTYSGKTECIVASGNYLLAII